MKKQLFLFLTLAFLTLNAFATPPQSPAMAFVKGGTFIMGNGAEDKKWAHAETVADFSMSRYEVTVGEYKNFLHRHQ